MFVGQVRVVILVLLCSLLSSITSAQSPTSTKNPEQATTQPSTSDASRPQTARDTVTLKYTPLFVQNVLQTAPAVTVSFPNHQNARFIIDTGSDTMAVSESLARRLGLSPFVPKDEPKSTTIDGKPVSRVTLPEFIVDATSSSPFPNASAEKNIKFSGDALLIPQRHAVFFGADGVIDTGILTFTAALFDGKKGEVTFIIGGKLSLKEREQVGLPETTASAVLTPLTVDGATLFTVSVTLENNGVSKQVALLVDTGSSGTSIPRASALALGLEPKVFSHPTSGVAGTKKSDFALVPTFRIGDLVLHNITVSYPSTDKEPHSTLTPEGGVAYSLGMNVLSGYRVLIDLPAHMMYLSANQPEPKITDK